MLPFLVLVLFTFHVQVCYNLNVKLRCQKVNSLNAELNPICYLLALLAHHFLHISRIRVNTVIVMCSCRWRWVVRFLMLQLLFHQTKNSRYLLEMRLGCPLNQSKCFVEFKNLSYWQGIGPDCPAHNLVSNPSSIWIHYFCISLFAKYINMWEGTTEDSDSSHRTRYRLNSVMQCQILMHSSLLPFNMCCQLWRWGKWMRDEFRKK
jgi:hypothetical protein